MAQKNKSKGKIIKSMEALFKDDSPFAKEYLEENGFNAEQVGKNMADFAMQLIESKKRSLFFKRKEKQINWTHASVLKLLQDNKVYGDDPITIIKEKSRHITLDAFSKGWLGPPFDVVQLAKMNNIDISPYELVPDARIIPVENRFKIEYNPFQSPARINFSIAHEIGHTLFADCADTVRYRQEKLEDESWQLEFLCNVAASELLLPYAEFSVEANEVDPNIDSLIQLAKNYNASVESVLLRYCDVVEKPCCMALASFNEKGELKVEYSKASTMSDISLSRGFTIPLDSNVYECKKSGWTSHKMESWEIFKDGTKYRVYGAGLSPIRKQTTPRVGILLVPEIYDTTPSRGIYWVTGDATLPRGNGIKVIGQVVNTSGAMGFGFGRAIAERYPIAKKELQAWKNDKKNFILGKSRMIKVKDDVYIFQMLAQEGIKPKFGSVPLKYNSLRSCLQTLYQEAFELNASIHIPAIGAGQAKGDWNVIKGMIHDELVQRGIDVTIYMRQGTNMKPNESRALLIFREDGK